MLSYIISIIFILLIFCYGYNYDCKKISVDNVNDILNCSNSSKLLCVLNSTIYYQNTIMTCYKKNSIDEITAIQLRCIGKFKNKEGNYYYSCLDNNNNYTLTIIKNSTKWIIIMSIYIIAIIIILYCSHIFIMYNRRKTLMSDQSMSNIAII